VLHYDGLMLCGAAVSCTSPTLSRLQPSSESQSIHGLRSPSALALVFEIDATVMSSPCFCSAALHDSSCGGEQWGGTRVSEQSVSMVVVVAAVVLLAMVVVMMLLVLVLPARATRRRRGRCQ